MFITNYTDRGVSPVIGVILMVAITVILASIIGIFVLDFADDLNVNSQASVTFSENNEIVSVQLNSFTNADRIYVTDGSNESVLYDAENNIGGVGTIVTTEDDEIEYSAGGQLTVIGVNNGSENVIRNYTMG